MSQPPFHPEARIAIAGAGCAGCTLAVELLARYPNLQLSMFDSEPSPATDKIWCSWETRPHRFSAAVSARWDRVSVRSHEEETIFDASATPYACIRAADFYQIAQNRLARPRCTIRRSTPVEAISETNEGVELSLRLPDGALSRESFSIVFDARPPDSDFADTGKEPMLLQHFGGVELSVTDYNNDASVATLMDFAVPQDDGTHFMYVLPLASDRIFVESTFMTTTLDRPVDYEANAIQYAREKLGIRSTEVVYRESGVLPMTLRPLAPASTHRIWALGTRAGIGRASSGYAFDAIQRDSRRAVDALVMGRPRPGPPRPRLVSTLDRVLLSLLSSDPEAASRVFPRLFGRTPPGPLIRFLADSPRPLDYLAVIWAMPKAEIIRHILTHSSAWPAWIK